MRTGTLLGGIDVFHLVADDEMRAMGLPGNHCAYALELDGRVDPRSLVERLQRAVAMVPELGWRLERPLLGRPRWVPSDVRAADRLEIHEGTDAGPLASVERLLERRLDGDRPWALDLVRGSARDLVVLRWFHPLTDARGAERLFAWFGSGQGKEPDPPPPTEERFSAPESRLEPLDREARVAVRRAYTSHVVALGRVPVASPWGSRRSGARAGRTRLVRIVLPPPETAAFDARVRRVARLAETSLMLRAAARVADAVLRERALAPARHVVPVPLSLDAKTGAARMLGNHLTMMMVALERADLDDEARAVLSIAEQQRSVVRDRLDLGMLAGLDLARWLPSRAYRVLRDRPFSDETASLVVSNPGAITISRFAGVLVRDAFVAPAVTAPPGLQVVFSRFGGALSALLVHVEGAATSAEIERAAERLRSDLSG